MKLLFEPKPGREAALFAEAQSLLDDGLDLDFVLALYQDDAAWLEPMLDTTGAIIDATRAELPSYFFEASLKQKFLAAAREQQARPAPAPAPLFSPATAGGLRTAVAGAAVVGAAALVGVLTLGFITARGSNPGDWNYAFKLAHDRLDYSLSSGSGRIDIQLQNTEARVQEIIQLTQDGSVSTEDISQLEGEAAQLADLAESNDLDAAQKARLAVVYRASVSVLNDAGQKPDVDQAAVASASDTFNRAVVAAGIGIEPVVTPSPSAAETPTQAATSTPEPSPSATSEATTTPDPAETPTAAATEDPTAQVTQESELSPEAVSPTAEPAN